MVIAYVAGEDAKGFNNDMSQGVAAGWVVQLEDEKFQGQRILVRIAAKTCV